MVRWGRTEREWVQRDISVWLKFVRFFMGRYRFHHAYRRFMRTLPFSSRIYAFHKRLIKSCYPGCAKITRLPLVSPFRFNVVKAFNKHLIEK
jgi:hypothetical protein